MSAVKKGVIANEVRQSLTTDCVAERPQMAAPLTLLSGGGSILAQVSAKPGRIRREPSLPFGSFHAREITAGESIRDDSVI